MPDDPEPLVEPTLSTHLAAAPVLSYATPLGAGTETMGVWREGRRLVTTTKAVLPRRCVKCNQEADGKYRQRKFYWYPQWVLLLILINILVLAIVALILRKSASVTFGLCRQHQRRRVRLMIATWLLSLAGIASFIIGPLVGSEQRQDWMIGAGLVGGLLLIIAAIVTGSLAKPMVPTKIDKLHAWFKGCGPDFLNEFSSTR